MVVELIAVGTELLLGNIVNTNARFLAENARFWGFPFTISRLWEITASGFPMRCASP